MDKVYYARKEEVFEGTYKCALYDKFPPNEDEDRFIAWTLNWKDFHRNTGIELKPQDGTTPGEVKKLRIRIEEVD